MMNLKQRYAIAGVILLNVVGPFLWFPYKGAIFQTSPAAYWAVVIFSNTLLPLGGMWILWKIFGVNPKTYSLPVPPVVNRYLVGEAALIAFTIGMVYFPASGIARGLLWQYSHPGLKYSDVLAGRSWGELADIAMSLNAGIFESVIFIGLPWLLFGEQCRSTISKVIFAVVTSLVFGCCHRGNGLSEVVAVTFFGLVAVAWFLKLRDLWPVALGHGLIDILGPLFYK